jgi:alkanesulfonate monooxygenase SsuD/methylene tetrahydromethanopterin reductase-like flavin-dependent oxidoreductase (luciferase family)
MVQDDHDNNDNNIKSINATVHINYTGKYYQLDSISVASKPFQKPHPPIFIGTWGSSEASLRRATKYGDGWMAYEAPNAVLAPHSGHLIRTMATIVRL